MNRRALVQLIAKRAKTMDVPFEALREGANHTVYSLGGVRIPVPRHAEIGEALTVAILKQTQVKLGEGWWR